VLKVIVLKIKVTVTFSSGGISIHGLPLTVA